VFGFGKLIRAVGGAVLLPLDVARDVVDAVDVGVEPAPPLGANTEARVEGVVENLGDAVDEALNDVFGGGW
jgi:hypothetical protein